jgi:fatty-acyl-CoA synthase
MDIAVVLATIAELHGDRAAVTSGDRTFTYGDLRDLVAGAADEFARRSVGTICYLAPVGPEQMVCLFAAACAGKSFAPLNYRLPAGSRAGLRRRLGDHLVVGDPSLVGPDEIDIGTGGWLQGLAGRAAQFDYIDEPSRPAVLLFTSGTSSAPKLARLGHRALLSYVFETVEPGGAGPDEASLMTTPPFHIAAVSSVLTNCWAGRRIVALPAFSAESWLTTVRREKVTHAFVVPTMLSRIVAGLQESDQPPPSSLRHLSYGGARMPRPLLETALRAFPAVDFVNAYGLTETSSTVCVLTPDDHRAALAGPGAVRRRLESVGRPIPGIELEVVDEHGEPTARGVVGRVRVRGAQIFAGYAGGDDVAGGRWLDTGDLGWLDADGYVFLAGRADDMIIAGGENISPDEIEDVILLHPDVTSVAVVGRPDDDWGEVPAAVVTLAPEAKVDSAGLTAWATARLGTLKTPRPVLVREALPISDTGKVLRRVVRQEVAEWMEANAE